MKRILAGSRLNYSDRNFRGLITNRLGKFRILLLYSKLQFDLRYSQISVLFNFQNKTNFDKSLKKANQEIYKLLSFIFAFIFAYVKFQIIICFLKKYLQFDIYLWCTLKKLVV